MKRLWQRMDDIPLDNLYLRPGNDLVMYRIKEAMQRRISLSKRDANPPMVLIG